MMTTKNLKYISLFLSILCLKALVITSCSGSNNGGDEEVNGSNQSVTISVVEVSSTGGAGKISYTADVGTPWSAEVISGSDFVSFVGGVSYVSGNVVSAGTNTLYFYYDDNNYQYDREAVINFAFNGTVDTELTLLQLSTESTDNPYSTTDAPRWAEIPTKVDKADYLYVVHNTPVNGVEARNYSMCYDTKNRAAAWVAYPFHSVYDGNVGRNEEWQYDPKIPTEYQPNLSRSYGSYNGSSYDRGHQMASDDRQATVAMNEQTFYYSNMTPQLSTLNQQKWATLESLVRSQVCSDTLYVVTGADFTTTIGSVSDNSGNQCPLPGAYYKVLLRTRTGYSGKAVSECSASELQAIGFWVEHEHYSTVPDPVSVKYIEEKTGFTFFPSVPDEVKESYTASHWSF